MKAVARAWDATLNDVALTILDAGVNRYLEDLGHPPDHPLVALCPVSLHDPDVKEATTQVSAMFPPLGAVDAPIDERLQQVMANTRAAKDQLQEPRQECRLRLCGHGIRDVRDARDRPAREAGARMLPANVLISNVRGPEETLYLNGARLEAFFPVSTLIVAVGLNVTFMSYDGQVIMGFTANGSALPEVESLAKYTREAFAALEKATAKRRAAGASQRAAPPGGAPEAYLLKSSGPVPSLPVSASWPAMKV